MEASTSTAPGFEVLRGDDDQHYWHLKAANGEIVAQSEGYTTEADAFRGIQAAVTAFDRAVMQLAPEDIARPDLERARARAVIRRFAGLLESGAEVTDEDEAAMSARAVESVGFLLLSVEGSLAQLAAAA